MRSLSVSRALFRRGGATERADEIDRERRGFGGAVREAKGLFVHVKAPRYLHLDGVDPLFRTTIVARRETASIRVVVLHAEARALGGLVDDGDHARRRGRSAGRA